jgi:hypothetical protein
MKYQGIVSSQNIACSSSSPLTLDMPQGAKEVADDSLWSVLPGVDAFCGQNASVLEASPSSPSSSTSAFLAKCRAKCLKDRCGGFVVWRGNAYFRPQVFDKDTQSLIVRQIFA